MVLHEGPHRAPSLTVALDGGSSGKGQAQAGQAPQNRERKAEREQHDQEAEGRLVQPQASTRGRQTLAQGYLKDQRSKQVGVWEKQMTEK